LKSSAFVEEFLKSYRQEVSFVKEDRILHYDIDKTVQFLHSFQVEVNC
jgi:histidine ammonia-lyase